VRLQCLNQALYDLIPQLVEQLVVIVIRRFITVISLLLHCYNYYQILIMSTTTQNLNTIYLRCES